MQAYPNGLLAALNSVSTLLTSPGARQFATTTADKSKVAVVGNDGDSVVEVVVYVPTGTLWVWCV